MNSVTNTELSFNAPLSEADNAPWPDDEPRGGAQTLLIPMLGVVAVMAIAIPLTLSLHNSPHSPFASTPQTPSPAFIPWKTDFEVARRQAQTSGKTLMVAFYTEGCPTCQWMEQEVYSRAPIIVEAQNFVPVKINAASHAALAERYSIRKYPSLVWVDGQGNEKYRSEGSLNGYELYNAMQRNL